MSKVGDYNADEKRLALESFVALAILIFLNAYIRVRRKMERGSERWMNYP
jgi:hypothetical protein